MVCHGQTGLARIDPIMSPGAASQHAHTIFGSSGESMALDLPHGNSATEFHAAIVILLMLLLGQACPSMLALKN
jgi:hypothetical protein